MGLHRCRPVRVPMLTLVHLRKCQQWAHQNWTKEQLKKVSVFFYIAWMVGCMRIAYIRNKWHQDAVKARRQCEAFGNVLLEILFH